MSVQSLNSIFFRRANHRLFLARAPDSVNGDGYGGASGAGSSFDEHASIGKGT